VRLSAQPKLFSIEVRLNGRDLARIGAKVQKKTKYNQEFDGGRLRIRTADPLGVNEETNTESAENSKILPLRRSER